MNVAFVHVVAGVVRDKDQRILLAQRRPGAHLAGMWEFPGGKLETGESREAGLKRELDEEIGIDVIAARPLIQVAFRYPEKNVLLDVHEITEYRGTPGPREGQPLAWATLDELDEYPMPEADRPVIAALRLPETYAITPPLVAARHKAVVAGIETTLVMGCRLIALRLPAWRIDAITTLVNRILPACRTLSARLLLHDDYELAVALGADGVHLSAARSRSLSRRPVPTSMILGVSCHGADELAHAASIGADFATLSPVLATRSHPQAIPLGWARFAELTHDAMLPVFALGGLGRNDVDTARSAGGQGIAAISAFFPREPMTSSTHS
ncbi:MAG: Nudix family hydrolase [Dokdonella sp.]